MHSSSSNVDYTTCCMYDILTADSQILCDVCQMRNVIVSYSESYIVTLRYTVYDTLSLALWSCRMWSVGLVRVGLDVQYSSMVLCQVPNVKYLL